MTAAPAIDYDDATHSYTVSGVRYPSVTEVISSLVNFDRVPRDVLERKRQIGRAVHRAIELYERKELDADTIDDAVEPYLFSWIRFAATTNPRIVAAEQIVYSRLHRIAGRLDINLVFPEDESVIWQVDCKCVAQMSATTALQTAAYAMCWNEMHPEQKITKRAGLQLQHDGSMARLFPYDRPENRNDWLVFQTALNLHRWVQNNAR